MDCADRAVLSTLGQAARQAEDFPQVGSFSTALQLEHSASLRDDLRSTWDTAATPARTNPASFRR
ncbi:MAG: Sugar phosphate isomerases/epimerase [uncultured Arthrobacter sp.]|uniref:Sugar phosphate isomerases/epimerase n=1 Tax=uncultured Arthrobacter sp. TaxID=114050 RepID=A0A6J4IBG4_9MICC|nr:MAG: Sugar phosphate isomerases/epimerase [uncultured Arthrobacter sp.]